MVDDNDVELRPDDTTELHIALPALVSLLRAPCTEDNWAQFEDQLAALTAEARRIAKIPERAEGPRKRVVLDVEDAQAIQIV